MLYTLDENGKPKKEEDYFKWGKWFETADRIVKTTTIGAFHINTVFLGINHGWHLKDPLLWETAVIYCDKYIMIEKYQHKEHALEQHDKICEKLKTKQGNYENAT